MKAEAVFGRGCCSLQGGQEFFLIIMIKTSVLTVKDWKRNLV